MFSSKKNDCVSAFVKKLVFMEGDEPAETPEAGETAAHEKKETPAAEKKEDKAEKKGELDLDDMSAAQKIALIKSVIKHSNDKLEDEEFGDFMEKVSKVVEEYADEEEKED